MYKRRMKLEDVINRMRELEGNYNSQCREVYFSPENIKKFLLDIACCENFKEMLITPYLINIENKCVYELTYYEFSIDMTDVKKSYFIEYSETNILPKEITENIKPKVVVAKDDKDFLIKALQNYLKSMSDMLFEEERKADDRLNLAKLFYQFF
jgi:hypothetical protein